MAADEHGLLVEYCLNNVDARVRALLLASGSGRGESSCLQRCGQCYAGPFLVIGGSTVNVTDGAHTYLHPCRDDQPVYCYSTMMMRPYGWFTPPEVQPAAEASRFLPYTDSPVWRYLAPSRHPAPLLYDVSNDPWQRSNLAGTGAATERRLRDLLVEALRQLQAPAEQYQRLGLPGG